MTYDQQRSPKENTMSSSGTKAAETKALYLQGYNVATDRLKVLQTPSDKPYSIVLDLDETVWTTTLTSSKRQKMVRPSILKIAGCLGEKAATKAVARCKRFPLICGSNGVQIYYISDHCNLSSEWYH